MLLQTHAYTVPRDRQDQHTRLMKKLKDALAKIGGSVEVYQQVGPAFSPETEGTGRFVQIIKYRDKNHMQSVQRAEKTDPVIQSLIAEFCDLVDLARQTQSGQFLPGYYLGVIEE